MDWARYRFQVPPGKRVRVIVDSDAACEADDPFAIAHALMSPKLDVRAVVAAHFGGPGTMEASHEAILRLLGHMRADVPALRGEEGPERGGEPSEGVSFIIGEARRDDPRPLFVLCLGAVTNVARALAEAPGIAGRMTVVSIGGHGYEGAADWREFNFGNDVAAANALLASHAPLWQIPASVYGTVRVGLAELQGKVAPCGEVGKYLFGQMAAYNVSDCAGWTQGESWSLGDSPAVGVALNPGCGSRRARKAPVVNPDTSYPPNPQGRDILVYDSIDARYLLEDFFAKLRLLYG